MRSGLRAERFAPCCPPDSSQHLLGVGGAECRGLHRRVRRGLMRFLFIDQVTSLERGRRITGIKSFSSSEPFLESHFTRAALVPGVLLIEAMAQLLGWLASYSYDFRCVALLALISDVTVPTALKPGVRVEIEGRLLSSTERDSLGAATATVDGEIIARVSRLILHHVPLPKGETAREFFLYYAGIDDLSSLERPA